MPAVTPWRAHAEAIAPQLDSLTSDEAIDAHGVYQALALRAQRAALRVETSQPLTVAEAAALARVPERRIRSWARARGATWAMRPSPRTLLVDERLFRLFLRAHNGRAGASACISGAPGSAQR